MRLKSVTIHLTVNIIIVVISIIADIMTSSEITCYATIGEHQAGMIG
jgi:hypothetical protein